MGLRPETKPRALWDVWLFLGWLSAKDVVLEGVRKGINFDTLEGRQRFAVALVTVLTLAEGLGLKKKWEEI